ncbi:MAG TPA: ornithine cyclodeaminase family protein [Blastocatellia bacterium]|jgi:Predicted ornithine cyclodeaminase, mu-crystallin homolog|nr:ornithine cyclodeaminase family protein [Blastocatellia bacterium]
MKVLILTQAEVDDLLPVNECIPVMAEALSDLARGNVFQPLRMIVAPPGAEGDMALMPSYRSGELAAYAVKTVCVFPQNPQRGLDAHQGSVMLFSADTGELVALMNASAITAIRTAAVSGVATQVLAREDAGELAIIGSGVQARRHIDVMACVRPIRRARVASAKFENAKKFAAELGARFDFPIEPVEDVESAVRGADLIVTATTAAEPILKREWISPGAHLNVVGSSIPRTREVDSATMAAASLFVDRRESTINEGGDYLFALRDGAIGPDHIRAEIGEILVGLRTGRTSRDEITLFKSLGLAIEDLASADYLYRKARRLEAGTWVEF